MPKSSVPAIDGWFRADPEPRLLGQRCPACGSYVFPPRALACPNPGCDGAELEQVELSNRGTVWSYAVNRYKPPEPFMAEEPFEPFAVAAVELENEKMVVMGIVDGDHETLRVGTPVELVVGSLYEDGEHEYLVWKWKAVA
jgi:uncharacterized OB-fold protein